MRVGSLLLVVLVVEALLDDDAREGLLANLNLELGAQLGLAHGRDLERLGDVEAAHDVAQLAHGVAVQDLEVRVRSRQPQHPLYFP